MEQQLTTTSILALFETSKAERKTFRDDLMVRLKEGHVNPLDIHLQIKAMEELAKSITDDKEYKDLLLTEAGKHGKTFEYHNAKIESKEVGVKYDFSACCDPIYAKYLEAAEKATAMLKEREKFLKNMPTEGHTALDEDSGEIITMYPPTKSSTTSIAVTLK